MMRMPIMRVPALLSLTAAAVWLSPVPPVFAQAQEDADEVEVEDVAGPEAEAEADDDVDGGLFSGLRARLVGPALTSGRIGDFAVNPARPSEYFVAVCSGGVWKTTNGGVTYRPVFDGQGSYSIGCLAMDPTNPNVVWVGTGENNSQRSVSFGDGLYKTLDGGSSWKKVGLESSEHIGMIAIDPRDPDVVYVAAQGPLWRSGGDRGLYKTTDGGTTWDLILDISPDTGINEVHLDPRDPDTVYASSYQRRRRVWTLINGGPESGIHKSTNGGQTWRAINRGLPGGDKGRIGLDISPVNPDVVYAIVEAAEGKGGFYRSTNRGETWSKRSSYMTSSPQYYNEIVACPHDVDRVYALDTFLQMTEDGGRTFQRVPRRGRHVDDHALWIDPDDEDHLLVGSDGGIYETWDRGAAWQYKPNLPITQFYRVAVDESEPFYYVYGGTQDNNTLGGPSRTRNPQGILNEDWFVTVGGDGFESAIDPEDPNIVYSQWQYGGLIRHDRLTGETVDIKPRELPGEDGYRWNWDAPLIISPHDNHRLYYGANILFRSDDRGESWEAVSDDLSRQLDRNALEVMGRIQPVDAVSKHRSTSMFGNLIAVDESPLVEGLLYVGTDDGLVQVTEDGGETWRRIELFPGVPDMTYVSDVVASRHDEDTVYVTFDAHKDGDFTPYVIRSRNRGETWEKIVGDLPERHVVYCLMEDHEDPDLLFVGTEFAAFFTRDGGEHWHKVGGVPPIAVKDLDIQRRENDLVLATFGRGIYILDDYTPIRNVTDEALEAGAHVFPIKPALRFAQTGPGRGSQGATFYSASNPPFGAVIRYHLKDSLQTLREKRAKAKDAPHPTIDELRAEAEERAPQVMLVIRDEAGDVVRRLAGSRSKGLHTATWDLRYTSPNPPSTSSGFGGGGPMAPPGVYTVEIIKEVDGEVTTLGEPAEFEVVPLDGTTFPVDDHDAVLAWQQQVWRLQAAVRGAMRVAGDAQNRVALVRQAIIAAPAADPAWLADADAIEARLNDLMIAMRGNSIARSRMEPDPPSISSRIGQAAGQWWTTAPPTQTQRDAYEFAGEAFEEALAELRSIVQEDLADLEAQLDDVGAPWTPGRFPEWSKED